MGWLENQNFKEVQMEAMTISQGLRTLKRLRGELATAQQRVQRSSSWQKGKEPEYSFDESLNEYYRLSSEVERLHARILRANAVTTVMDDGEGETEVMPGGPTLKVEEEITLSQANLRLAEIKGQIALLSGLNLQRGEVEREHTYGGYGTVQTAQQPLVYESAMTERDRDERVKKLRGHFERLNDALERVNHSALLPA